MNRDNLSRIICPELNLRAYTLLSSTTVNNIIDIHKPSPNGAYALGRTINAAALLSATLKTDSQNSIAVKFSGSGPLKEVYVQCDAMGNIRGYTANPVVDFGDKIEINFSKSIGAGFLTILKDSGQKEPYSSVTPLQYGEIAEDIAYYLTMSEQIPSALILGLSFNEEGKATGSGGILIQTFPDTENFVIEKVERNIIEKKINLTEELKDGNDIYSVLSEIFDNNTLEIMDSYEIQSSCRCNKEMLVPILKSLEKDELKKIIEEDGQAEVKCTFCNSIYHFSKDDLNGIIS